MRLRRARPLRSAPSSATRSTSGRRAGVVVGTALVLLALGTVAARDGARPHPLALITADSADGPVIVRARRLGPGEPIERLARGAHILAVEGVPLVPACTAAALGNATALTVLRPDGALVELDSRTATTADGSVAPMPVRALAALFAAVGALIFLLARARRPARLVLALTAVAAAYLLLLAPGALAPVLAVTRAVAEQAFGWLTPLTFLTFPIDRLGRGRTWRWFAGWSALFWATIGAYGVLPSWTRSRICRSPRGRSWSPGRLAGWGSPRTWPWHSGAWPRRAAGPGGATRRPTTRPPAARSAGWSPG